MAVVEVTVSQPRVVAAPDWTLRLLPDLLAEFKVEPVAVLHVGAYHGEEVPIYLDAGFQRVALVEPDPDGYSFMLLQPWAADPRITVYPVACGKLGTRRWYRTEGGAWNGLKPSVMHPPLSEISVVTVPISSLQSYVFPNVLVVDTQGTELEALATAALGWLDMIIVETHEDGADGAHPDELGLWAESVGWQPVVVLDRTGGWTDTVLVKT